MKTQNYINHIAFVVDRSGSMGPLANSVIKVFDHQIKSLSESSQKLDQETRASVYLFDTNVDCLFYDKDVMRLPSLEGHYRVGDMTALRDGTKQAIEELKQTAQLHGDHAFLLYVLTDGEENASRTSSSELAQLLKSLPDNWTVAVLVPNINGVNYAANQGFARDNIMQWDTTVEGLKKVSETMRQVTESYMTARASGVRGTRSLFTLDTSNLASRKVSDNLDSLKASDYVLLEVKKDAPIQAFVEREFGSYVKGNAYYELMKTEEVQDYKQVAVQNKISGKVYTGLNARNLLGLPNTTVKVKPEKTGKFNIFIQSTSVNRKLIGGTQLLVLK